MLTDWRIQIEVLFIREVAFAVSNGLSVDASWTKYCPAREHSSRFSRVASLNTSAGTRRKTSNMRSCLAMLCTDDLVMFSSSAIFRMLAWVPLIWVLHVNSSANLLHSAKAVSTSAVQLQYSYNIRIFSSIAVVLRLCGPFKALSLRWVMLRQ